jgi:hypothetical protein
MLLRHAERACYAKKLDGRCEFSDTVFSPSWQVTVN